MVYFKENNLMIGKVPCGRDGQTAILSHDNKMIVFGGDRHLLSFNDTYFYVKYQFL